MIIARNAFPQTPRRERASDASLSRARSPLSRLLRAQPPPRRHHHIPVAPSSHLLLDAYMNAGLAESLFRCDRAFRSPTRTCFLSHNLQRFHGKIRFGPFTYPRLGDRAVTRAADAPTRAHRTAPRRCRREPRDLAPRATRETSGLASARTPRMVPPSPHAGPGTVTPHHGSLWGNNKENAAGVTPGPMAYGTTPGAKTNAESVAKVRRRPDTSFTRASAPIPRRRARRRPRLDP